MPLKLEGNSSDFNSFFFFILNFCLEELLVGLIQQVLEQPKRGLRSWISLVI